MTVAEKITQHLKNIPEPLLSCQVSSVEWFINVAAGLVPAFFQCRDAINRVSTTCDRLRLMRHYKQKCLILLNILVQKTL